MIDFVEYHKERVRWRMFTDMREFMRLNQSELDVYKDCFTSEERHRLEKILHHAQRLTNLLDPVT